MTIDFLEATKGHSVVLNFSTIPQWMYKTEKPVAYPDDPEQTRVGLRAGNRASRSQRVKKSPTIMRGYFPGTRKADSPTNSESATNPAITIPFRTGKF